MSALKITRANKDSMYRQPAALSSLSTDPTSWASEDLSAYITNRLMSGPQATLNELQPSTSSSSSYYSSPTYQGVSQQACHQYLGTDLSTSEQSAFMPTRSGLYGTYDGAYGEQAPLSPIYATHAKSGKAQQPSFPPSSTTHFLLEDHDPQETQTSMGMETPTLNTTACMQDWDVRCRPNVSSTCSSAYSSSSNTPTLLLGPINNTTSMATTTTTMAPTTAPTTAAPMAWTGAVKTGLQERFNASGPPPLDLASPTTTSTTSTGTKLAYPRSAELSVASDYTPHTPLTGVAEDGVFNYDYGPIDLHLMGEDDEDAFLQPLSPMPSFLDDQSVSGCLQSAPNQQRQEHHRDEHFDTPFAFNHQPAILQHAQDSRTPQATGPAPFPQYQQQEQPILSEAGLPFSPLPLRPKPILTDIQPSPSSSPSFLNYDVPEGMQEDEVEEEEAVDDFHSLIGLSSGSTTTTPCSTSTSIRRPSALIAVNGPHSGGSGGRVSLSSSSSSSFSSPKVKKDKSAAVRQSASSSMTTTTTTSQATPAMASPKPTPKASASSSPVRMRNTRQARKASRCARRSAINKRCINDDGEIDREKLERTRSIARKSYWRRRNAELEEQDVLNQRLERLDNTKAMLRAKYHKLKQEQLMLIAQLRRQWGLQ